MFVVNGVLISVTNEDLKEGHFDCPAEIVKVEDYAFSNCNALTSIKFLGNPKEISRYAFYGCSNLATVHLPYIGEIRIGNSEFYGCLHLADKETTIKIAQETLDYCRKIIPRWGSNTHPSIVDKEEIKKIGFQVGRSRLKRLELCDYFYLAFAYHDNFSNLDLKQNLKIAKTSKVGNCGELSDIAIYYLMKQKIYSATKLSIVNWDHNFIVMNDSLYLDLLNDKIIEPSKLYDEIHCYRINPYEDNPHLSRLLTPEDQLNIQKRIIHEIDFFKSQQALQAYQSHIHFISLHCANYFKNDEESRKQFLLFLEDIHLRSNDFRHYALSTIELGRFITKELKKIRDFINSYKEDKDELFGLILADFLSQKYSFPFHLAIDWNLPGVVENLARQVPHKLFEPNNIGSLPLHLAAYFGHAEIVNILLSIDPRSAAQMINLYNLNYETAAYIAAENGNVEVLLVLAVRNANVHLENIYKATPLFAAAANGHAAAIKLLAKLNVDLNAPTILGFTPTFIAAQNGHELALAELINFGADFESRLQLPINNLKQMAQSRGKSISARMEQFILEKNPQATQYLIDLSPRDIAVIMGHQKLVQLLDKATQERKNFQNKTNSIGFFVPSPSEEKQETTEELTPDFF